MKYRFIIVSCCGDYCGECILDIPENDDPMDHYNEAISEAGFRNRICDGCYDSAYRVKSYEKF